VGPHSLPVVSFHHKEFRDRHSWFSNLIPFGEISAFPQQGKTSQVPRYPHQERVTSRLSPIVIQVAVTEETGIIHVLIIYPTEVVKIKLHQIA